MCKHYLICIKMLFPVKNVVAVSLPSLRTYKCFKGINANNCLPENMDYIVSNSLLGGIAFLLSYIFVPTTAYLSHITGAMDLPDGERKINTRPMPRLGGLGFFLAFFITALIFIGTADPYVAAILTGGAIIVAAGVADDTRGLSSTTKLVIQVLAATVALSMIPLPKSYTLFGTVNISLSGALGFLFSLFRIVFTCNAVNFADGLDGLAAGLSSVALLSLTVFGFGNGNHEAAAAALALCAATLGFLPHNRYRAKVFMGDCGSQFLGLSIAILSLATSADGSFTAETSLFLAIPIIDVWASVIRRIISGKNPFRADKGHLHHLLLTIGLRHEYAVKLLVSVSALIALFTLELSL
jgi:UDP-GlcNAc:undecaprenyl-phosphate GlcNAc-1-phosphate transferase